MLLFKFNWKQLPHIYVLTHSSKSFSIERSFLLIYYCLPFENVSRCISFDINIWNRHYWHCHHTFQFTLGKLSTLLWRWCTVEAHLKQRAELITVMRQQWSIPHFSGRSIHIQWSNCEHQMRIWRYTYENVIRIFGEELIFMVGFPCDLRFDHKLTTTSYFT